jgi:hypothetical protein
MIRSLRLALGLVAVLFITGREARAQWGYGGWGWGGWGANTPQGATLAGAGQYAMGAGMYNLDTAQARSINADTAMRWNQYAYMSHLEATSRYAARKNAEIANNKAMYNREQQRIRENPEPRDIANGDTLNAFVTDLNNPNLGSAAMRAGQAPIPASVIAEIPFLYASERITIMLDKIRESVKWPTVFAGERFANTQTKFDELRARLRKESEDGEVSAAALKDAKQFVDDFREQLETQPLPTSYAQKEAMTFISSCASLLGLLEKPDIGPAILELRKVTDTKLGNLLGFMHAFNLRFGPAKTPKQRQAYDQLYRILAETRQIVLAEAKGASSTSEPSIAKHATDFLQNIRPGKAPAAPAPPKAQ